MEDMEGIRGDHPFQCASVKHVVSESKQGGCVKFSKKKEKKGDDTQEKRVAHIDQETSNGEQETEQNEHSKTHARENQCGNIIDIEA